MSNIFNDSIDGMPEDWLDLRPEDLQPKHWAILTDTISSN